RHSQCHVGAHCEPASQRARAGAAGRAGAGTAPLRAGARGARDRRDRRGQAALPFGRRDPRGPRSGGSRAGVRAGRSDGHLRADRGLALGVLVEVHSEAELDLALAVEPAAVGVNSRDLGTFAVDLALAERLLARVPAGVPAVAESGIETRADVERMAAAGADLV